MTVGDDLNCALQTIVDALPSIDHDKYLAWIRENTLADGDREDILASLAAAGQLPSISVLIASRKVDDDLRATLRSLADQLHQNFEVVIACSADQIASHSILSDEFPELSIVAIAGAQREFDVTAFENAAFNAATKDYAAFLAPGDQLAAEATAETVLALVRRPETIVVFTDEDWIDSEGERSHPRFKDGWDPDAQLGFDLMGRFSPIRSSVLQEVGGLNPDFGLAAHYDLHCRVAEYAGPLRILHIPSILRHAAKQPQSSAAAADLYAEQAREVAAHSARRTDSIHADLLQSPLAPWLNRVRWSDPDPLPMVSVLMPTRDRADLVSIAARGVLDRTDYPKLELLILDNGSVEAATFALFENLSQDRRVRVIPCPGPFNFSRINNLGAEAAFGDVLLMLNNDVDVIHPEWLREMVSLAVRDEIACVGAKLLYGDGRIQHAGVSMAPHTGCAHVGRLNDGDFAGDHGSLAITSTHSAVTAACLAIRKSVFEEIGRLDEVHLHVGYNDVDLCLRAADHGYRSVVTPFARLYHLESVSRGPNDDPIKRTREKNEQGRLIARYREIFLDDPHQNPNLHLAWEGNARLVTPRRPREWEALNEAPVSSACEQGRDEPVHV